MKIFRTGTFIPTVILALLSACTREHKVANDTRSLLPPSVVFSITPEKDTTLFGVQGTRLFIEKGTFVTMDNSPVQGPVSITLEEYYSMSDILMAGLTTTSDGRLLSSAGMLNIRAMSDGKELQVANGKSIVVHFPKPKNADSTMQLFYRDENKVDNWNIDTVSCIQRGLYLSNWSYSIPDNCSKAFDMGLISIKEYTLANTFSNTLLNEVNNYPIDIFFKWRTKGIWDPVVNRQLSEDSRQEFFTFMDSIYSMIVRSGIEPDCMKGLFALGFTPVYSPKYALQEPYQNSFNNRYAAFEKEPIKNMDDAELNYYIFSVTRLGWINCDRFYGVENKVDYFVDVPVRERMQLNIVFSDIHSVVPFKMKNGKYVFEGLPAGRKATVFALDNASKELKAAFQEVTISSEPLTSLPLKEITLSALNGQLARLNEK